MEKYDFNTYVINLQQDKQKWNIMKQNLSKIGITPIRFNAIYGKKHSLMDNKIDPICKMTCTNSIIGCGLSHIYLNDYIYNNNDKEYALILEDDTIPRCTVNQIKETIKKYKDYDAIMVYCQGFCKDSIMNFYGSTAAYIVNKKGASFIRNLKLLTHIDVQLWNMSNIKMKVSPTNLFITDESDSVNRDTKNKGMLQFLDNNVNVEGEIQLSDMFEYKTVNLFGKDFTGSDVVKIILITIVILVLWHHSSTFNLVPSFIG